MSQHDAAPAPAVETPAEKPKPHGLGVKIARGLAWPFRFVLGAAFGNGLLGFTTVLSVFLAIWLYYFFGVAIQRQVPETALWGYYGTLGLFTHNRIMHNLAWFASIYVPLSVMSAALNPMDLDVAAKGRRVGGPLFNHATSLLPLGVMVWVFSTKKVTLGSAFLESAALATTIIVIEICVSIAMSLIIANSRKKIA